MATEKRLIHKSERADLIRCLKKIHDLDFTPGVYEHSVIGRAALFLEETADAVEVVRCKDCMWARAKDHREPTQTPGELICQCAKHHHIPAPWGARMAVSPDDFCSYGERRTNEPEKPV